LKVLREPDGSPRTAGLVEWVQSLFAEEETDSVPVLIGGSAVELYTGGAHTTADIDFSGKVPAKVGRILQRVGFRREGRSWVHDGARVYLDFTEQKGVEPSIVELKVGESSVKALAPEDLIVERLVDYQKWRSEVDAVNAFLVFRSQRGNLDRELLQSTAGGKKVEGLLQTLRDHAEESEDLDAFLKAMEAGLDAGHT
jgi:hypothetical protein